MTHDVVITSTAEPLKKELPVAFARPDSSQVSNARFYQQRHDIQTPKTLKTTNEAPPSSSFPRQ